MKQASAPPTDSVPLISRLLRHSKKPAIVAAILASFATIVSAFIGKDDDPQPASIQVNLHKDGDILAGKLKVVGPEGYKAGFENGELDLPAKQQGSRFTIYSDTVPRKLLGTFIWTGYVQRGAFIIHIEKNTDCWETAASQTKI